MGEIQIIKKKKFLLENLKVGYQLVVTAVDREILLNYSLEKWDVRMGSGLIWLRTGTCCQLL